MNIIGIVVHGRKEGRKIGFPTANINTIQDLNFLRNGVYATKIKVGDIWYKSATSYGTAPAYGFNKIVLESHILDFDQDIYDQIVELKIVTFLRDTQNYPSLDLLIQQIHIDCNNCRIIL